MPFELDLKSLMGALSVLIVVGNHCYYLTLTYLRRVRPHAFTLAMYFIVTITVAIGMMAEGDVAAAWRMGLPTPLYIVMLVLTLRQGVDYIRRIDAVMLGLSLLVIPLWMMTDSPRAAILFLALVEGLGMIPSFRKAYVLPFEDSVISPLLSASAMLLAFVAVKDPAASWATAFYLAYWVVVCLSLAALICWRRYATRKLA